MSNWYFTLSEIAERYGVTKRAIACRVERYYYDRIIRDDRGTILVPESIARELELDLNHYARKEGLISSVQASKILMRRPSWVRGLPDHVLSVAHHGKRNSRWYRLADVVALRCRIRRQYRTSLAGFAPGGCKRCGIIEEVNPETGYCPLCPEEMQGHYRWYAPSVLKSSIWSYIPYSPYWFSPRFLRELPGEILS